MPSHPARTLSRPTGRGSKTTKQPPICAYPYNYMMPSDGAGRTLETSVKWVSLLRLLAFVFTVLPPVAEYCLRVKVKLESIE